ncbi:MAG: AAA family ATPase [Ignavibacteria bacterium]|nr:AAA family ATPase [Ignavibacteria bacterium]
MKIHRLKLTNWKNFQDLDVSFADRTFIVGANASGKSNLLDALRFVRDIAKQSGGLQYAVGERGGVPKIRCLSARAKSHVAIEIHLTDKDTDDRGDSFMYRVAFQGQGGGVRPLEATIVEEAVMKNGEEIFRRSADDLSSEDSETLKVTSLEQATANRDFREIFHFFRDMEYLHVVPQLIRDADSYFLTAGKEDFYGRNILDRMELTNKKTRESYFKVMNEVLRLAVPQFRELNFVKDPKKGIPHLQARYNTWRGYGAKQQEQQFSDGTLRLIGFLWALLDSKETVLLEEPELYLHAAIVRELPQVIARIQRRKQRKRQVILTTHSHDLLNNQGIGAEEVILVIAEKEGSTARVASDIEGVRQYLQSGFTVGEAVLPMVAPENITSLNTLPHLFD